MTYLNGKNIVRGDFCWYAEKRRVGIIAEIVESVDEVRLFDTSEPGIFISENLLNHNPQKDLFIAKRFFDEEEINCLNEEELRLVKIIESLFKNTYKNLSFNVVAYTIQCLDNPLDNIPPLERIWAVRIYGSEINNFIDFIVCNNFSELKKITD